MDTRDKETLNEKETGFLGKVLATKIEAKLTEYYRIEKEISKIYEL